MEKNKTILLLLLFIFLGMIVGGIYNYKQKTKEDTIQMVAEKILTSMTLEEKVGQMMFIGIEDTVLDADERDFLFKYNIGGIVLFDRNMQNPRQVTELINDLQTSVLKKKNRLPLFVALDQEGGMVARMENEQLTAPPQEYLGKQGNFKEVKKWAIITAIQLKAMGFNVNFAPVVDLGGSFMRSFCQNAEQTILFAKEALAGYKEQGIIPTLKHFPGIGKGKLDTHFHQEDILIDEKTLMQEDVKPFCELIKDEDRENLFIMVSHVRYHAFDKENVASLSFRIVDNLLRKKLGFQGLIITDDLGMMAVKKQYKVEDVGKFAVLAGNDFVLICRNRKEQYAALSGIVKAVQDGVIPERRIDESVKRIIVVKLKNLKQDNIINDGARAVEIIKKVKDGLIID